MKKIKKKAFLKAESGFLLGDSLIIVFILLITYALYFYRYFPNEKKVDNFLFSFEVHQYEGVDVFMWTVFSKLVPLLLLILWFITCKHWWYYAIGIPISVYIFQFIVAINDDIRFTDESEFIYSIPFTLITLALLLVIRNRLSTYLKAVNLKKEVDETMDKANERRKKIQEEIMEDKKL